MDKKSLSHTRWKCQYHIVFIPKYRKKVLYGRIRTDIPSIYDWASLFRLYEIGLLRLLYLYTQYIILQELLSEFRENELVIIYEL